MIVEKFLALLCRRRYRIFLANLTSYQNVQSTLQRQLFQAHMRSAYGKHLKAKHWNDIPIVNYQDIAKWMPSSACFHMETSGSSCSSKRIPYTKELRKSFLDMFKIWAYDLLQHVLKPQIGKLFISLSPPGKSGLKDDTQYLGLLLRTLLKPYLVLPPIDQPDRYCEGVARALCAEKDLGIISIWNPTYLLQVMEYIEEHRESFSDLIDKGPIDWQRLWPKLQLISCWTAGWAAGQAETLKTKFPNVTLQGKGLLATEAPISIPLNAALAPVPLIDEVYFEFEDAAGNIASLDQVRLGESYELIISQKGGLIRYRLGDKVNISAHYLSTPCLTFLGRVGHVCDMVGEKLDSLLVEEAIQQSTASDGGASILIPVYSAGASCHYVLLTESSTPDLKARLESELQKIYHYRVARLTGQLACIKVMRTTHLQRKLQQFDLSRGMSLGDIKGSSFIHDPVLGENLLSFLSLRAD